MLSYCCIMFCCWRVCNLKKRVSKGVIICRFSSRVEISTRNTDLKKNCNCMKISTGLKHNILDYIENLMKVRKLNRKPGKSKSKQRWLQSIKRWNLKFFNKLMLSLLFLQILAASHWLCFCQGLSRNFWISYLGTFKFLLIFYKINKFVISLFETCLWSQHFYFITRNSRMCSSYQIFIPAWLKCRL